MFYVIKDSKLYEFGDRVNSAWSYPNEAKELSGVTVDDFYAERDRFKVENGILVDISQTEAYLTRKSKEQNEARKAEIQKELDALDLKCIRAMREGGNDDDGVPFLEKYQSEIELLREEYNSL